MIEIAEIDCAYLKFEDLSPGDTFVFVDDCPTVVFRQRALGIASSMFYTLVRSGSLHCDATCANAERPVRRVSVTVTVTRQK